MGSAFCRIRGKPGGAHREITGSTFCSGGPPRSSVPHAMALHFSAAQGCIGRGSAVNIFEGTEGLFFRIQPPTKLGLPSAARGIAWGTEVADCLAGCCAKSAAEKTSAVTAESKEPHHLWHMLCRDT